MPNNASNGGGNGLMTALIAILVIAVVGFGIWYVMNEQADEAEENDSGLNVSIGGGGEE